MLPKNREPTTPGEILREEFLVPMDKTQTAFAAESGIPERTLSRIINGHHGISPETAWKLADSLGTTPQLWLSLQANYDLWKVRNASGRRRTG